VRRSLRPTNVNRFNVLHVNGPKVNSVITQELVWKEFKVERSGIYILYLGTQLKNNKKNIIFMDCRKNHILKKL